MDEWCTTQGGEARVKFALLVGDMPFMTYNIAEKETVRNAGRFIKEGAALPLR
jgi:ketopantoate hydroxymethyltransferase